MEQTLREYLKSTPRILHCGATGTELMKVGGVTPGPLNNKVMPDKVFDIQKGYVDIGAKLLLTNTFGMNRVYVENHVADCDLIELNNIACTIARKAAGDSAFVLGNMGPCGGLLEPFGELNADAASSAFKEQADILIKGGVDGISLQTFFSLEEMILAVKAIRSFSDIPVFSTMTFDKTGKTMMGESPVDCYKKLYPLGIDAFGHNCGEISCVDLAAIFGDVLDIAEIPIIANPNAGLPKVRNEETYYDMTVEEYRDGIAVLADKGVRILGGCCGVGPEYISAIKEICL